MNVADQVRDCIPGSHDPHEVDHGCAAAAALTQTGGWHRAAGWAVAVWEGIEAWRGRGAVAHPGWPGEAGRGGGGAAGVDGAVRVRR